MAKIIHAADLFCGAGGTTTGLNIAAEAMGLKLRLIAVNHWERAIETHAHNHPWAHHFCTGLDALKPSKAVPGRKLDLLIASPECTHHSVARGGKPCDDQSRSSAWHILHWCQELYVRNVLIENVPEFTGWGPLGANGRPLKSKKGLTFQAFLNSLRSLGYSLDWKIVNCADHGDATTRQRFFLLARRGNRRIRWPDQTHARKSETDIFGNTIRPWKPARDIIDWSIPGNSIFLTPADVKKAGLNIKRPLAENTLKRIEAGIRKFWGDGWVQPFLVVLYGTNDARSVSRPFPTVTASGTHIGLCRPFVTIYKGNSNVRSIDDSLPTVTTNPHLFLCEPFIVKYYGTAKAVSISEPLDTVTTDDRFGLVRPKMVRIGDETYLLDILFRMLTPRELAAAHSFPADYHFAGNKSEVVKQIGNSVPVKTANALCEALLAA